MVEKNTQLTDLIAYLNKAVTIVKNELIQFNGEKEVFIDIAVYQNILQRLYYCIQSVECLLHKFKNDTNFKFTIGLILRNGILDFIIAQYLFEQGHLKGNLKKEFARINHQYVSIEVKECQSRRNLGSMTKEEFEENLNMLKFLYPENFYDQDKSGIPIFNKNINSISVKKMAETLRQDSNVYHLYHYHSQYEHFGTFSKLMIDGHAEYDFDKMKVTLCYILTGVNCCLHVMGVSKEILHEISDIGKSIISMSELYSYPKCTNSI